MTLVPAWLVLVPLPQQPPPASVLSPVPFQDVVVEDEYWSPRLAATRRGTLEACLERCVETGRVANFARAAGWEPGGHQGALYNDSDVYKVIEGAAKCLALAPDPALEERVAAIVAAIVAAQEPSGYLNTYVTLAHPELRWKNLAHGHELYCGGHLIEAAIAWQRATGRDDLLGAARRFADLAEEEFGAAGRLAAPGHQEIELALLALAAHTGEERYARLAERFLAARGAPERAARGELYGSYSQDERGVWEERSARGHAVRAMYQYCAMTDLVRSGRRPDGLDVLRDLWSDVVGTKTYVTGGLGSEASIEGFGAPFDLPNESAYCETCASVGLAGWAWRMLLATGEAGFADTLERALYNNVLAGVSLAGDRFFYGNPLASDGGAERVPWFDCSCCPTNVVRTIPGIGGLAYAVRGDELAVALYLGGRARVELAGGPVEVTVRTAYPWQGRIRLEVDARKAGDLRLRLRRPEWCRERPRVEVDGQVAGDLARASAPGEWMVVELAGGAAHAVELDLPLVPRRVHADPRVAACAGRVALARGPLVYAVEGVDHGGEVASLVLPSTAGLTARWRGDLLGGAVVLQARARRAGPDGATVETPLTALPYPLWGHRGAGAMEVWIAEDAAHARAEDTRARARIDGVAYSASHCWQTDTVAALGDGLLPRASGDPSLPRHTFWSRRGTSEWLRADFEAGARTLERSSVYWFDDTGVGSCRVPAAWRLEWLPAQAADDGDAAWRPVELAEGSYACDRDRFVEVRFAPVAARALRLRVELRPDYSAGVLEWRVGD